MFLTYLYFIFTCCGSSVLFVVYLFSVQQFFSAVAVLKHFENKVGMV